jgi:methionine-gamma-lyase
VYLESPSNPTLDLLDLGEISKIVQEHNAKRSKDNQIITVIDNTFATPWCQRPIEHGINVVLHSLTKNLSGFGTELGGVVITKKDFFTDLFMMRKDCGGVMSPQTAWHIMVYGVSTLSLRLKKQQENAYEVANFLETHPKVEFVRYPGLKSFPQYELAQKMLRDPDGAFAPGAMLYFAVKGDSPAHSKERGGKLMNYVAENSYAMTLAVSLGQLKTLIEHPGSMTHASYSAEEQLKRGMHPGGIRLSIGVENPRDIITDLEHAFKTI